MHTTEIKKPRSGWEIKWNCSLMAEVGSTLLFQRITSNRLHQLTHFSDVFFHSCWRKVCQTAENRPYSAISLNGSSFLYRWKNTAQCNSKSGGRCLQQNSAAETCDEKGRKDASGRLTNKPGLSFIHSWTKQLQLLFFKHWSQLEIWKLIWLNLAPVSQCRIEACWGKIRLHLPSPPICQSVLASFSLH